MMRKGKVMLLVCVAALFAGGCGAGTEPSSQGAKRSFMVSSDGAEQPDGRARRERAAHCDAAAASLGERRGAIRFQVSCTGPESGGSARFVVERYLPRDPARMRGPHGYPGSLEVSGGSGQAHRGRCTVRRRILECRAEVSGSVTLAGAFAVERRTACTLAVSMIEIGAEPCDRGGCQGPVRVRELFDGRPKGC